MHPARALLMLPCWEQVLNGLVYELYFPQGLHAAGLRLFDLVAKAELPDINAIPESRRLRTLRQLFETLYSSDPLSARLCVAKSRRISQFACDFAP